jgi:hypothetical protein
LLVGQSRHGFFGEKFVLDEVSNIFNITFAAASKILG